MSKLNYLIDGDLYPMKKKSFYFFIGEKRHWRGLVMASPEEGRYTGICDSEEEADREAYKLLERLRQ